MNYVTGWEAFGWGMIVLVVMALVWLQVKGGGVGSAVSRLRDGGTTTKRK